MMPIHQYDFDVATCLNFLREYGLLEHFKLNLETNHATLARHTMHHECEVAAAAGALGKEDFISLEKYAMSQPDPVQYTSGRQEFCENIINAFI